MSGIFQNIDPPPPPPFHPASVSSPRIKGGGISTTHSPGGEGVNILTPDIGLASYSLIPLRKVPLKRHLVSSERWFLEKKPNVTVQRIPGARSLRKDPPKRPTWAPAQTPPHPSSVTVEISENSKQITRGTGGTEISKWIIEEQAFSPSHDLAPFLYPPISPRQ